MGWKREQSYGSLVYNYGMTVAPDEWDLQLPTTSSEPDNYYFKPANGELVVHACVEKISSPAWISLHLIKKVTFKHTVSNPVIIMAGAFQSSGVELVDVPPRATFKTNSFRRSHSLQRLEFRESSDYQALKIEAGAFAESYPPQSKEFLLCAPLIYASTPALD